MAGGRVPTLPPERVTQDTVKPSHRGRNRYRNRNRRALGLDPDPDADTDPDSDGQGLETGDS
jgi:hypothetical protein